VAVAVAVAVAMAVSVSMCVCVSVFVSVSATVSMLGTIYAYLRGSQQSGAFGFGIVPLHRGARLV